MLIDSHVHLQDKKFSRDLDRVLMRAQDAGLERLVCTGDRIDSSKKAVGLARRHQQLVAAVGVHPHHDAQFTPLSLLELERLARDPMVVAIGEIGLDFHYPNHDPKRQIDIFTAQAHLAHRHDLPLIIHCRDAYDALIETLRDDARIPRRGVVHCFSGTLEQARELIRLGFYLGIGGAITYPNGDPLREVVRRLGLERILSETDAPYLPPQCKRGRRNEPSYMKFTIKALAELTELSYQDTARITKTNAIRLFDLPARLKPSITYAISKTLYVSITNQCPNDCYYCQRCSDYIVMGHLLKLDHEPSAEELLEHIETPSQYREIALSGLGEPTMRWEVCMALARRLKEAGARVRLNTNGQGNLINGRNIVEEMAGFFDSVVVSMIAHDKATYNRIAQPSDPEHAWDGMLDFVAQCKQFVPEVQLMLVAVPEVNVEAARHLAEDELGVTLRIREDNPRNESCGEAAH